MKLGPFETLYLHEKGKIQVLSGRSKKFSFDEVLRRAKKGVPDFWTSYVVFRDLRSKGYIVKTALKFGAQFRVYDKGIKPGKDHAKWVVFPSSENKTFTWHEWSAKNRVAHSTRKRLLIGIVDDEDDVTYWEARWLRP